MTVSRHKTGTDNVRVFWFVESEDITQRRRGFREVLPVVVVDEGVRYRGISTSLSHFDDTTSSFLRFGLNFRTESSSQTTTDMKKGMGKYSGVI